MSCPKQRGCLHSAKRRDDPPPPQLSLLVLKFNCPSQWISSPTARSRLNTEPHPAKPAWGYKRTQSEKYLGRAKRSVRTVHDIVEAEISTRLVSEPVHTHGSSLSARNGTCSLRVDVTWQRSCPAARMLRLFPTPTG